MCNVEGGHQKCGNYEQKVSVKRHLNLETKQGVYERISKRHLFYQTVMLIVINITGLFILKGKHGLNGRGK